MKHLFNFLILLAFFLGGIIILWPLLPRFLSYQDRINPQEIGDNDSNSQAIAIFNNQPVLVPNNILGDIDVNIPDSIARHIEVDLTTQRLYGYENNQKVFDFLISSGKWDRTPTGTFIVWKKVRSQKMSGGSKELGTYYYLPNVPYILFFYNDRVAKSLGYSLHGTYWHDKFGQPMSHGCINMKTSEVAQIYAWASEGTTITISGKYVD